MIDINGWEVVIILVLIMLVFGPERLPEFLYRAGQLLRQFRQMTDEATSEITREFRAAAELAEAELKTPLTDTLAEVKAPFTDLAKTLTAATAATPVQPAAPAAAGAAASEVPPSEAAAAAGAAEPDAAALPDDLPSIAPPPAPYPPLFDGPADNATEAPGGPPAAAPAPEDPDDA